MQQVVLVLHGHELRPAVPLRGLLHLGCPACTEEAPMEQALPAPTTSCGAAIVSSTGPATDLTGD
ncbi:hypothetical protein, partial [Streptomyces broussonetiae]|uniref:hypothetical protein n=1 Tax=Streptomyces broussonetiae TaxID=2686304 RepID=UPI0035DC9C15